MNTGYAKIEPGKTALQTKANTTKKHWGAESYNRTK